MISRSGRISVFVSAASVSISRTIETPLKVLGIEPTSATLYFGLCPDEDHLVRSVGLEPTHSHEHQILSLACLPFTPRPQELDLTRRKVLSSVGEI